MQTLSNHKLEVGKHPYAPWYIGYCDSCNDPDWTDEGVWVGQVEFEGLTQQEVIDQHHDHVIREEQQ